MFFGAAHTSVRGLFSHLVRAVFSASVFALPSGLLALDKQVVDESTFVFGNVMGEVGAGCLDGCACRLEPIRTAMTIRFFFTL